MSIDTYENDVLKENSVSEFSERDVFDEKNDNRKFSVWGKIRKHINPVVAFILVMVFILSVVAIVLSISTVKLKAKTRELEGLHRGVYDKTQEIVLTEEGDRITTYNYAYGQVSIPAIAGVPKSTYKDENFSTDSDGFKHYYIDGERRSYVGIDVSEHNGSINWDKVKDAGVDFVMLRIGGRGWGEEGVMYADSAFMTNLTGARDAGLMVGAYFFSQAITEAEAIEEAEFSLEILGGESLDYPLAFDWETIDSGVDARTDNIAPETLTKCARAFCDRVKEAGYTPCLYTGTTLAYYKYDLGKLSDIDIWYAYFGDSPALYYNYMMWQYSSTGRVDGVSGDVDLNICFKNYK